MAKQNQPRYYQPKPKTYRIRDPKRDNADYKHQEAVKFDQTLRVKKPGQRRKTVKQTFFRKCWKHLNKKSDTDKFFLFLFVAFLAILLFWLGYSVYKNDLDGIIITVILSIVCIAGITIFWFFNVIA